MRVAKRLCFGTRAQAEKGRDVGWCICTLAVVRDMPPRTTPDDRRVARLVDDTADPGLIPDDGQAGDWPINGDRHAIGHFSVRVPAVR
jgi:hypothetical protein